MSEFQKHTKHGRPMVYRGTGLPVYDKSLHKRTKDIKTILTIGMKDSDARWFHMQNEIKQIGFNT